MATSKKVAAKKPATKAVAKKVVAKKPAAQKKAASALAGVRKKAAVLSGDGGAGGGPVGPRRGKTVAVDGAGGGPYRANRTAESGAGGGGGGPGQPTKTSLKTKIGAAVKDIVGKLQARQSVAKSRRK